MNVSLTPQLEEFVNAKVESGRYTSASEVVREALRLLEEHELSRAEQLEAFNKELARRLASTKHVEPGEIAEQLRIKSLEVRGINRYCYGEVPHKTGPGIYRFFLKPTSQLVDIQVPLTRVLYVGRTKAEDGRNHFDVNDASKSTFRRTLGAILKNQFTLKALPRGDGLSSIDFSNYRFTSDSERKITLWMQENLEFSFEIVQREVEKREAQEILDLCPPLNLLGWENPYAGKLKRLRRICRDEAAQNR